MSALHVAESHQAGPRQTRANRRDFYRRYDLLLANWYLLTSRVQREIESIRQDLHAELASWQPHLPEPDWSLYALRLRAIC
jgi:hypothetical protein